MIRAEDFTPKLMTGGVVLAAGLGSLLVGLRLWRHRQRLLDRRGTAYVIEEPAAGWVEEDKQAFFTELGHHFPAVRRVPTAPPW